MSRFSPFALAVALPLTALSQPALADLTPAQVWGDWRGYMEGMGYDITATETASGGDLTVSDIIMRFAVPDTDGDIEMSIGAIRFDQNSDGSVAIILPDTMPMQITGNEGGPGGQDFTMMVNYSQTGQTMTASGTPENTTYTYNAATVAMDIEQIMAAGEALGQENVRVNFTGTNLQSTTAMTVGDMRDYDQTSTIDEISYDFFFEDPQDPGTAAAVKGSATGISATATGAIPLEVTDTADMAAMMRDGFDMSGTLTYASGNTDFDVKDPENGNFVMRTNSQGGSLGVKMGLGGIAYDVSQTNMNAAVQIQGLPIPFEVAMAESGFNLSMPVAKSDDPQDFALGVTMGDFTMSDVIWGIFDPGNQLPRDPATVLVDLSGKVKLLVDWMNPEVAAQMPGAPGEVEAVTLSNLLVDAVGAKLEGNGAITFDGAAPALIPGVGTPVGDVNLALAGGNGLLDKLVAMGLLPQEQAMGARMMMGLFAVPGDAPDTLQSKIEFTPDGQILANGQRIR